MANTSSYKQQTDYMYIFDKSETQQTTPHEPHQTTNPTQGYIKQTHPSNHPSIHPSRSTSQPSHLAAPHHTTPLRANPPTSAIVYEKKKKKKLPTQQREHIRKSNRTLGLFRDAYPKPSRGTYFTDASPFVRSFVRSFVRTLAFTFCTLDRHSWIRLID